MFKLIDASGVRPGVIEKAMNMPQSLLSKVRKGDRKLAAPKIQAVADICKAALAEQAKPAPKKRAEYKFKAPVALETWNEPPAIESEPPLTPAEAVEAPKVPFEELMTWGSRFIQVCREAGKDPEAVLAGLKPPPEKGVTTVATEVVEAKYYPKPKDNLFKFLK